MDNAGVGYAACEQPFGLEPPQVHCPICGTPVLELKQGEWCERGCDHLEFVFSSDAGEFVMSSGRFDARLKAYEARLRQQSIDPETLDKLLQFSFSTLKQGLERLAYGSELLALEITYGGMACGPVWYTDIYGFNYASLGDSQ